MSELTTLIPSLGALLQSNTWLQVVLPFFCFLLVVIAVGGVLFALKKNFINRAITVMLNIVILYLTAIAIYYFVPSLRDHMSQLPFLDVYSNAFVFRAPLSMTWTELFPMGLNFAVLAFLINLTETCLPATKNFVNWLAWRVVMAVLTLALYAVYLVVVSYLPAQLIQIAFGLFLFATAVSIVFLLVKLLISALAVATAPAVGTVLGFFTVSRIGSHLSKTALSCLLTTIILQWLDGRGWTFFTFEYFDLAAYWPSWLLLVVALYIFSKVFYVAPPPKKKKEEDKCPCPKKK